MDYPQSSMDSSICAYVYTIVHGIKVTQDVFCAHSWRTSWLIPLLLWPSLTIHGWSGMVIPLCQPVSHLIIIVIKICAQSKLVNPELKWYELYWIQSQLAADRKWVLKVNYCACLWHIHQFWHHELIDIYYNNLITYYTSVMKWIMAR